MKGLLRGALLLGAGAAIGATAVVWLMSDSGKKVRGEVRDIVNDAVDKMKECREELKQRVEEALRTDETEPVPEA